MNIMMLCMWLVPLIIVEGYVIKKVLINKEIDREFLIWSNTYILTGIIPIVNFAPMLDILFRKFK